MKKSFREKPGIWIGCAGFCLLLSVQITPAAHAQSSSTASATSDVRIVQGSALVNVADLRFGAIVPGASGGTVTVAPEGNRTKTGTIILPTSLSFRAAVFVMLGSPNQSFTISLPSSITLGRQGGSESMSVGTFTSSPSVASTLSSGGSVNINVGATLTVSSGQTFGQYTGSFSVTVNYQ